ncbi:MAG: hypothetical protein NZZ41_04200 [Candidatus Dojkabacteria bacterium]|nr:hypothetical protein [Candidatus Dojkabacteria bacterium]
MERIDLSYLKRNFRKMSEWPDDNIDLNSVDPNLRPYYEDYLRIRRLLKDRENILRTEADNSQTNFINQGQNLIQGLLAQRTETEGQIRDNLEDALLANRLRARAFGGAPSSALLDINARTEREAMRNMNKANIEYGSKINEVIADVENRIGQLEVELLKKLAEIEQDRTLSLRQRDAAIQNARLSAMRGASGILGGLNFGEIETPAIASEPQKFDWSQIQSRAPQQFTVEIKQPSTSNIALQALTNQPEAQNRFMTSLLSGSFSDLEGMEAVEYALATNSALRQAVEQAVRRNPSIQQQLLTELMNNPTIRQKWRQAKDQVRRETGDFFGQIRSAIRDVVQPLNLRDNTRRIYELLGLNRSIPL